MSSINFFSFFFTLAKVCFRPILQLMDGVTLLHLENKEICVTIKESAGARFKVGERGGGGDGGSQFYNHSCLNEQGDYDEVTASRESRFFPLLISSRVS